MNQEWKDTSFGRRISALNNSLMLAFAGDLELLLVHINSRGYLDITVDGMVN